MFEHYDDAWDDEYQQPENDSDQLLRMTMEQQWIEEDSIDEIIELDELISEEWQEPVDCPW